MRGGVCDYMCRDFEDIEPNPATVRSALEWLRANNYIEKLELESAWAHPVERYRLNWSAITEVFEIESPPKLKPISPGEFGKLQWRKLLDSLGKKNEEG